MPLVSFRKLRVLFVRKFVAYWFHYVTSVEPVSVLACCLSFQPSPGAIHFRFILSCFRLSTEYLRSKTRSLYFYTELYLTRFSPYSRCDWGASTQRRGYHGPATFRPQVFSTSRRFTPPSSFTGLFHPATTFRILPVQGLLPPRSAPSSSKGTCLRAVRTPNASHPKMMSTFGLFDFKALFYVKVRSVESGIRLPFGRSPPRVPPSPGFSFSSLVLVTQNLPLMKLLQSAFTLAFCRLLQRFKNENLGFFVSKKTNLLKVSSLLFSKLNN